MPSHTEAERRKVRALISRPINSFSGINKQREKIKRKVLNFKANPRSRPTILTPSVESKRPAKPIITKPTQPTDITGKAQSTAEKLKARNRLLKNF
ncbi:MAG TPA: hypothetical protein ENI23_01670 [bacterium]|nr:hypothetical protein [bacterium]